jgi:hypothetical protein
MALAKAVNYPSNCGGFGSSSPARVAAKEPISQRRFSLSSLRSPRIISGASAPTQTTVSAFGCVVNRISNATTVDDLAVFVTPTGNGLYGGVELTSETPGVVTGEFSAAGEAAVSFTFVFLSAGSAIVEASAANGFRSRIRASVGSAGGTTDAFSDYTGTTTNNLGKHLESQVASRSGSVDIFSVADHSASSYQRNTAFWLADVDFTCFSPWNSVGGQGRAGTLISPQFIMCADHFPMPVGATVRFVGPSGQVVERTVSATRAASAFDVQIAKLSSPITEHITPCKVMPAGYVSSGALAGSYKYAPSSSLQALAAGQAAGTIYLGINDRPLLPAIGCNQDKKAGLALTQVIGASWNGGGPPAGLTADAPGRLYRPSLNIQPLVRQGCSGSPVFFLVNGELCLAGVRFYANSTGTAFTIATTHTAVQDAMDDMGSDGDDTLTPADFSQFTDFSS